jgi:hypothetical protein
MMKVLVVSPRFAPSNAPDMHRARLLLRYARESGWDAEVLAVDADDLPAPVDPWLATQLPAHIPIHRVRLGDGWLHLGVQALWVRSLRALFSKGSQLLSQKRFDLVFFSTTEFPLHILGPLWKRRFGVPFCMDFQDPWVTDYYRQHPEVTPPGGRFKHAISTRIDRILEPLVVSRCAGFLSVSERYLRDLNDRYGARAAKQPRLVKPFPGEPEEQAEVPCKGLREPGRGPLWRYIGRGGEDMRFALRGFLAAWKRAREERKAPADLVFEAVGTSYAPAGTGVASLRPEAALWGLDGSFVERTDRVAYTEALALMRGSDALVAFGSNDPGYTASKIYPYVLSRRPLLAIFHEKSSVVSLLREVGGAVCVSYNEQTTVDMLRDEIWRTWFYSGKYGSPVELDHARFAPYTAREQAIEIRNWFGQILAMQPR